MLPETRSYHLGKYGYSNKKIDKMTKKSKNAQKMNAQYGQVSMQDGTNLKF